MPGALVTIHFGLSRRASSTNLSAALQDILEEEMTEALNADARKRAMESNELTRLTAIPEIVPICTMAIQVFAPPMEGYRRGRDFSARSPANAGSRRRRRTKWRGWSGPPRRRRGCSGLPFLLVRRAAVGHVNQWEMEKEAFWNSVSSDNSRRRSAPPEMRERPRTVQGQTAVETGSGKPEGDRSASKRASAIWTRSEHLHAASSALRGTGRPHTKFGKARNIASSLSNRAPDAGTGPKTLRC